MLLGKKWVIEHLRSRVRRGNTREGREWAQKMRAQNCYVAVQCDECGIEDRVNASNMKRMRHLVKKSLKQEEKFGLHLCEVCIRPYVVQLSTKTKNTPEWKEARSQQSSWQSRCDPKKLQTWKEHLVLGGNKRYKNADSEEKRAAAVKQWETMTEEVKKERARKIGEWSKKHWASLTPEQRKERVQNMIKGLPRSEVSNKFRQALIEAGSYKGFKSEVTISGFVVDECNEKLKAVFEFFGDYYHCNPQVYADPNFYNSTTGKTASQQWQYDRRRLAALRKAGYVVLVIWEKEWNRAPEAVLQKIRVFLSRCSRRKSDEDFLQRVS